MQQRARCISVLNSSLRFLSSEMCSSRQRLERLVSLESSRLTNDSLTINLIVFLHMLAVD